MPRVAPVTTARRPVRSNGSETLMESRLSAPVVVDPAQLPPLARFGDGQLDLHPILHAHDVHRAGGDAGAVDLLALGIEVIHTPCAATGVSALHVQRAVLDPEVGQVPH